MTRIRSGRTFQLWEYRVSHEQLLLRSPKSEAEPRNFDVIFVGVEYLDLPTHLKGLEVAPANSEEIAEAGRRRGKTVGANRAFALVSGGQRHLIVAANVRHDENELDLFDSSLESFRL